MQGELDHQDSEKIGFFKANKERIREELDKLREGLEDERVSLSEDRIKLEIYKSELKQRKKAIEVMRMEYIKVTSGDVRQFSDQAKDLGHFGLVSPPSSLYPMPNLQSSPPAPHPQQPQPESSLPRFNYTEYMHTLKIKLELAAPHSVSGSSFSQFLLKEKQQYLTAVARER